MFYCSGRQQRFHLWSADVIMNTTHNKFELLMSMGIANPMRHFNLAKNAIRFLKLDLRGFTVLTEAASGPYAVTPLIAALAGAEEVFAFTKTSPYASAAEAVEQIRLMEEFFGTKKPIKISEAREESWFNSADIITNLGFVRPLDKRVIQVLKKTAVIPLMFETWEFRPEDIDLAACRSGGIEVFGTNENYPGLEVFQYSGWLAMKLLFEAQIEVFKSQVIVISSDSFGTTITNRLNASGAGAMLFPNIQAVPDETLSNADVLLIADYKNKNLILGPNGQMESSMLAKRSPGITVVPLVGWVDEKDLQSHNITVHPKTRIGPSKMSRTLADLGPRPVIELNTAGLKVGEITARSKRTGQPWQEIERDQGFAGLVQEMNYDF